MAVWCFAAAAVADAPPLDAGVPSGTLAAPDVEALAIEQLRERTRQIRELREGRLDVAVDPNTLFTIDLGSEGAGAELELLLREVGRDRKPSQSRTGRKRSSRQPARTGDPLEDAHRELVEARVAFLALSPGKRAEILSKHENRRREAEAEAASTEAKTAELAALQSEVDRLEAFLEGKLDPSVDPQALLQIDASDLADLATSEDRRRRFLDPDSVEQSPPTASGEGDLDAELEAAQWRRDSLWRRIIALSDDARSELIANQAEPNSRTPTAVVERVAEAELAAKEAAQQRDLALVDSESAETEALRLVADRRARLLSVKAAQAKFGAELANRQAALAETTESALAWRRRVREARTTLPPGAAREKEADALYRSLVADLTGARRELSLALDAVNSEPTEIPTPADSDMDPLPADIDESPIRELRTEIATSAIRLRAADSQLRWDRASALRDDIVMMNRSRLRLFEMLSEPRRDRLEGFGAEGIAQVNRELEQIILEARFHLLSLPRQFAHEYDELRAAPGPFLVSLFQFLLLVLGFRWWRRRADSTLERIRINWLQKRPQTQFTRGVATITWYLRRLRKPIEWFVFFALLLALVSRTGRAPEAKYIRIVVLWLLTGGFVVHLVDATASRQGLSSESSPKLRFRSLRMVGVSVIVLGMILSLTVATVGKGAIYAWVISSFWLLAIPLAVVLVFWWRDTIFERTKGRETSRLLGWVSAHEQGVLKYPAAAIGGVYLLVEGVAAFFVNRVSELAPLRRFLAYMFRRGIEKSSSTTPSEYGTEPIPDQLRDALAPHPTTPPALITSYMSDRVHAMRAFVRSDDHAIIAVVGERGLGKSTFLQRVSGDMEPGDLCSVQCQPGGFAALLREFARALELPETATEEAVVAALRERAPRVICVDDAQRLVRPLIGGLGDIDHLSRFIRLIDPQTSWFIAIGKPAWNYLQRARGDRAVFDRVIELEPWEESQIAALVDDRTNAAGITPDFEGLVVPRQLQASNISPEERTKRDFYRILWDYSDGNPRVALHFWRESLFLRPPDDAIHVRLFAGPATSELEDLPSTFYFVLRTVVQLELAVEEDVVACTDLSPAEVADALRAARVHGYISENDVVCEISLHWYRAITSILRRKHLLLL